MTEKKMLPTLEPCEVQGWGCEKRIGEGRFLEGSFVEVLEWNSLIQLLKPMRGGKT